MPQRRPPKAPPSSLPANAGPSAHGGPLRGAEAQHGALEGSVPERSAERLPEDGQNQRQGSRTETTVQEGGPPGALPAIREAALAPLPVQRLPNLAGASLLSKMIRPGPTPLRASSGRGVAALQPSVPAATAAPSGGPASEQPHPAVSVPPYTTDDPHCATAAAGGTAAVAPASGSGDSAGEGSGGGEDVGGGRRGSGGGSGGGGGGVGLDGEDTTGASCGGGSEGQDPELEHAFGRLTGLLGSGRGSGSGLGSLVAAGEPSWWMRGAGNWLQTCCIPCGTIGSRWCRLVSKPQSRNSRSYTIAS